MNYIAGAHSSKGTILTTFERIKATLDNKSTMQSVIEFLIVTINQTKMSVAGKFDLQTAKFALLSQHTAVNVMSIMPEKLTLLLANA